jgi:hypothetical protein
MAAAPFQGGGDPPVLETVHPLNGNEYFLTYHIIDKYST